MHESIVRRYVMLPYLFPAATVVPSANIEKSIVRAAAKLRITPSTTKPCMPTPCAIA